MRLCRYDDDRLGVVRDGDVHDVTHAQNEIRAAAPYTMHGDPVIAALPAWRDTRSLTVATARREVGRRYRGARSGDSGIGAGLLCRREKACKDGKKHEHRRSESPRANAASWPQDRCYRSGVEHVEGERNATTFSLNCKHIFEIFVGFILKSSLIHFLDD